MGYFLLSPFAWLAVWIWMIIRFIFRLEPDYPNRMMRGYICILSITIVLMVGFVSFIAILVNGGRSAYHW